MRLRNIPGAKDAITESSYVVQTPTECKTKWAEQFPKEQPIHIEVGMGKGRFLMDMARLHPDINALRKFESAGVIESRSSGMKGTYIKVLNEVIFDELEEIKAQRNKKA